MLWLWDAVAWDAVALGRLPARGGLDLTPCLSAAVSGGLEMLSDVACSPEGNDRYGYQHQRPAVIQHFINVVMQL